MKIAPILVSLLVPLALHATTVYSNTTNDTGGTVFYSTGPYLQIGDQISLAGTDRAAVLATTQFYDNGTTGTFDATLMFFDVGAPVGSEIGSPFTVTGNSISNGNVVTVSWILSGLVLPDNVIFTVSVSNLSDPTMDLGLTMFDPPTIPGPGGSDNTFYIVSSDGIAYSQASQGNNQDNIYFSLDAVPIPEPGTLLLTLLAIPALGLLRRRLR